MTPTTPATAGLPPMMALACAELARALREPPNLANKWPFADPPGLVASRAARQAAEKAKGGRPSGVQPNQVVRMVRHIRQGDSRRQAAARVGLTWSTASDILAGRHDIVRHPAVTLAGVSLPDPSLGTTGRKPAENPETPPSRPDQAAAAPTPAQNTLTPRQSPLAPEPA